MKKKKIIIITIISIISLIFLDFIIALSFNNSPLIKIRDYYNSGSTIYIDKGIFTNTYKCFDGKTNTVLKTTKYACPMKDSKEDKKEPVTITITFDTNGGSKIDSVTIKKETELILPEEPTLDGYVFKGWIDKNEMPIYNKVILREDTTLYAVWEKVDNKETNSNTNTPTTNNNSNNNTNSNNNIPTNKPNQNVNNNSNNNSNTKDNENTIIPEEKPPVIEKTQAEKNNEYRKKLENKYSVKILYKDENSGYLIGGSINTEKLNDDNEIDKYLKETELTLKKYPTNFFKEMKDNNVALKIHIVNKIDGNYSGMTDGKNQSNITITIGTDGTKLFESTLHHELMHYIDIYMRQKNPTLNLEEIMRSYNPEGFSYGSNDKSYDYNFSNPNDAYFLSYYSRQSYLEDRAVLFSDMMTRTTKRPYYNDGTPINKKAKLISSQIKEHFNILSNTGRYYWDRFL